MSDYEHRKGTITKASLGDKSPEQFAKDVIEERDMPLDYSTYLEQLKYDYEEEYIVIDGIIYEIEYTAIDPYDDIMEAKVKDLLTIEFDVKYYNGGCSMIEAIHTAVENMQKKEKK